MKNDLTILNTLHLESRNNVSLTFNFTFTYICLAPLEEKKIFPWKIFRILIWDFEYTYLTIFFLSLSVFLCVNILRFVSNNNMRVPFVKLEYPTYSSKSETRTQD